MATRRSIFQEVGAEGPAPAATPGGVDRPRGARRGVRLWMGLLFLMVVAMISVGGLTRLTDSGLSITEWRPVSGALPPMTDADWATEFAKYQAIPEFQLQNAAMTVEEFKGIYWWEWGHRQLGRSIGLVWALGFLGFALARQIPPGWAGRMAVPGLLGGVQGAVGWWMVSSGLTGTMVDVASYRLALHLGLAFAILGLLAWYIFLLGRREAELLQARRAREPALASLAAVLAGIVFVQVLLGALVAGIDAGRGFPTWPLMGETFFPADDLSTTLAQNADMPTLLAALESAGLVQFVHRMWGYVLLAFALYTWVKARASAHLATRRAFDWVLVIGFGQVVLGIVTALTAAAPHAAITHQLGAVVLWVLVLRARQLALYPLAGSIRKGTA